MGAIDSAIKAHADFLSNYPNRHNPSDAKFAQQFAMEAAIAAYLAEARIEIDAARKENIAQRVADEWAARAKKAESELEAFKQDAKRWRYTQQKGYFVCGPYNTDGEFTGRYSVGIQPTPHTALYKCIKGRAATLAGAIDEAIDAGKASARRQRFTD